LNIPNNISDGRSDDVSTLGSHQMTLEVFGGFNHLNLVIVFESEIMCAKENLVKEDTTNIFNFFNLIEKKISLKQKSKYQSLHFPAILEPMTSFILMDSSVQKTTGEYVNLFTLISNSNMDSL